MRRLVGAGGRNGSVVAERTCPRAVASPGRRLGHSGTGRLCVWERGPHAERQVLRATRLLALLDALSGGRQAVWLVPRNAHEDPQLPQDAPVAPFVKWHMALRHAPARVECTHPKHSYRTSATRRPRHAPRAMTCTLRNQRAQNAFPRTCRLPSIAVRFLAGPRSGRSTLDAAGSAAQPLGEARYARNPTALHSLAGPGVAAATGASQRAGSGAAAGRSVPALLQQVDAVDVGQAHGAGES
jgi:hypothetical protein